MNSKPISTNLFLKFNTVLYRFVRLRYNGGQDPDIGRPKQVVFIPNDTPFRLTQMGLKM